jgi:GAF domain-containing protein
VLQVISRSTFDLQPVLDAIVDTAARLCNAGGAGLAIRQGDVYRYVATYSLDPEWVAMLRAMPFQPDRGTVSGRALLERRVTHVVDLAADPEHVDPRIVTVGGIRTLLAVPLLREEDPIGVLTVGHQRVQPFTERQIELVRTFADQAVIAMENARLLTETREALEQQTATAEVLQVINSSPGDLAPVFDAMLERGIRLCEASFGVLYTFDGERFQMAAARGLPAVYAEYLQRNPLTFAPGSGPASVLAGQRFHTVVDFRSDQLTLSGDPQRRALVELGGARSGAAVPLRKDATLLGIFLVFRPEVRPFTEKQIALLENFAAQAVIAMENARLLNETREALEQQTATAEVLQVINSSPGNRTPVFEAILEKARVLCGAAHGSLSLYDGKMFRTVAINTRVQELADQMRQGFSPSDFPVLKPLLDGARLVQVPDLAELGNPYGARTGLFVPLRKDDALLGLIITVRLEIRPFSPKEIALVENFAAQAVIAIENARLLTETREALEQQTATAEVLQVINSSPGDLAPVFDAILEKAHALCGATYGNLQIYDGEHFRAVAVRGAPEPFEALLREPYRPVLGLDGPTGRLIRGDRFVQIADLQQMTAELEARGIDEPRARGSVELVGARTVLFIPLRKDGALLGFISALRQEVLPFTDKEIALLQNFAAQAVIAMENARLLTETREALEQQTRPPRYCRSSTPRPATSRRSSMQYWKRREPSVGPSLELYSSPRRKSIFALWPCAVARKHGTTEYGGASGEPIAQ